jgi:hypothetical protein
MKKRKRAPGGGRKPRGEYANRRASFTMRMSQELRNRLDRECGQSGRVLSQEVEHRLQESFAWPIKMQKEWGPPHIMALARLVVQVARAVEGAVGASFNATHDGLAWHRNRFTHAALTVALNAVLEHFKPGGKLSVPKAVKASAARFARVDPDRSAEHYRRPETVGLSCGGGVIVDLQVMDLPQPGEYPPQTRYADAFYRMERVRHDLGID